MFVHEIAASSVVLFYSVQVLLQMYTIYSR